MDKIRIEIQYFSGCPHFSEMIRNVKKAIAGIEDKIDYSEFPVEDEITAAKLGFRGSPSLLINGKDFEGLEVPEFSGLFCRFYKNGLPSSETIRHKIDILL